MSVFIGYPSFMAYQVMKGKKGNNEGFPSIPGMIARYSSLGLTNEQMATNRVWVDKTGNGYDTQLKNFSWKGMSGVGGVSTHYDKYEFTPDKYHLVAVSSGTQHAQFTFKVTGLVDGNTLSLEDTRSPSNVYGKWTQDGIYTVDIDVINTDRPICFYNGVSAIRGTFTIEILPLYPGFILGDGVDDFAVTEKVLNFEDTYTVYTAFIPFQNNPTRNMMLCGADNRKTFSMRYPSLVYVSFIAGNNYYINADFVNGFNLFACKRNGNNICIKNLLTNKVVTGTCGDWVENARLYYLWTNATYESFAKAAIAGQTICNGYFSTDEDDEKVLDWYKKQYPWLFPDQAWTVVGKTNEDEDRATIANIMGNGNDLVLSNFGFIEGSGYNEEGEYAGYLVTDGVDDKITSSAFKMGKDFTVVGEWKFLKEDVIKLAGFVKYDAFMFYNYSYYNRINIYIYSPQGVAFNNVDTIKAVTSEGQVYFDFNSIKEVKPGDLADKGYVMNIGHNGSNHTKLAFKNLAIYPTVLSKDDCIKAYNYLQTLKAK